MTKLTAAQDQSTLTFKLIQELCNLNIQKSAIEKRIKELQAQIMPEFKKGNGHWNFGIKLAASMGSLYLCNTPDSWEWQVSDAEKREILDHFYSKNESMGLVARKSHDPHLRYDYKTTADTLTIIKR